VKNQKWIICVLFVLAAFLVTFAQDVLHLSFTPMDRAKAVVVSRT
jgi:hypothetical protein